MAKLRTEVDPSDGASPGTTWPKAEAVDDHVEVHTARSARRGAASDNRRLDSPREDVHGKHPWTSAHLPDTVPSAESKRGGRTTERRSSPTRSTASELNDGEGAGPSGQGAALGFGEALEPAHEEREGVRWLDTDNVAGTEARRGSGSLPEANKRLRARMTSNGVASSYRLAHGVRGTGRLRHSVQRTAMLL
jgi:hypothetical protein